jgi:hypothetical protein
VRAVTVTLGEPGPAGMTGAPEPPRQDGTILVQMLPGAGPRHAAG